MDTAATPRPAARGAPERLRRFFASWVFSPLDGVTWGDWWRLVRRSDLSIDPVYWPRAAFTSGMALLTSAVARVEQRRWAAAWSGMRVTAPVFVLGHHRSGTTHLWNVLSQDPAFAYPSVLQAVFPHSFLTFEPLVHGLASRWAIRKRPQDNVPLEPDSPIEEERALCTATFASIQMARHFPADRDRFARFLTMKEASPADRERWKAAFDQFARKLLVRHGADRTLLFKSPDHTGKVALIRELYPDARFVHIHRDPYVVFASTRKMERTTQPIYAFQRWSEEEIDAFILWRYRAMYDAYLEDRDAVPSNRLVEIAFSELESAPMDAVRTIYERLELELTPPARDAMERYLATIAGYRKNVHPALAEPVRARIADAWGSMFDAWGYSR